MDYNQVKKVKYIRHIFILLLLFISLALSTPHYSSADANKTNPNQADSKNNDLKTNNAAIKIAPEDHNEKTNSKDELFDPADLARPAFRTFTDRDGLPQNTIVEMVLDKKGYLWAGTQDGAAWYNGRSWTIVETPKSSISNYVRAILPSSDGSIWLGKFDGGLCRLKDGQWTVYDTNNGLPSNQIRSLLETTNKKGRPIIWVGTTAGLACLEDGKWTIYNTQNGLPANTVFRLMKTTSAHNSSIVWVGTYGGGLARIEDDKWTIYNTDSGLPSNSIRSLMETIEPDGTHVIWVGTDSGGLARLEEDSENGLKKDNWTIFNTQNGLPSNRVDTLLQTIARDGTRTLWIGTAGGLVRIRNNKLFTFNVKLGLPSNSIWSLLETSAENGRSALWIGTFGGLARLEEGKWLSYDTRSGLPDNGVFSILETFANDGSSVIWMGTFGGGLARLEKGQWSIFDTSSGLPDNTVHSLFKTTSPEGDQIVWAGTASGLARYQKGRWSVYNTNSGLPDNGIQSILETIDSNGLHTLWLGTKNGLASLKNGQISTEFNDALPKNARYIECFLELKNPDGSRTLWVGTREGGLARLDNGKWTVYDTKSGINSNWVVSLHEVIADDGSHWLWAGTNGGGVSILKLNDAAATWSNLAVLLKQPLPNNVIYQIREDFQKQFYLFTAKGVIRLTPRTTSSPDSSQFHISTYNIEDGLPAAGCTEGGGMVDSKGRLWAGTTGGVALLDPKKEIEDRSAKPLYIERTMVNGKDTKLLNNPSISYNDNNIVFEYALLSYFRESDTQYKTQLIGLDKKPSEWTADNKREYTFIPQGNYKFLIWGKDYCGNISGPFEIPFIIAPPYWLTWWFATSCLIIFMILIYSLYSWRVNNIQMHQERKLSYLHQLLESIRAINSEIDLNVVLQTIAEESGNLIKGEPGGIGLIEGDEIIFKKIWGKDRWQEFPLKFKVGVGPAGLVALNGKAIIVNDPQADEATIFPEEIRDYYQYGYIYVPIFTRKKSIVGVLNVRRPKGRPPFTEAHQQLLESLAHQAAVAIEKASLYGELADKNEELKEKNLIIAESLKEIQKLYEHEQEVAHRLQELNQMKSNFIVITSHEMRTPLTVIKAYTETLLDGTFGNITKSQSNALIKCQNMINRMIKIFNDIMEIFVINEGRAQLKPVSFDLSTMIHSICESVSTPIQQRKLHLTFDIPKQLKITADQEKIELVLKNLIQNSIKFTPDDGEIEISIKVDQDDIHLMLKDNGIGIEKQELEYIFDKFYTNLNPLHHTSGEYKFSARGTGLGLAIVKSYIELHGGKIWAESAGEGQGSCFHIKLPKVAKSIENTELAETVV